ncbi:hypothetical protein SLS62_006087 [Diatrype stigma]|uniref:UBC core domain-containing protein n=1 Tax=Diatrype stigma TaxID=117547 RepID=A0AAN9UN36_9PEZI
MAPSSRARLQADLASAAEKDIPNVHSIRKRDDGFVFTFHHQHLQPPHHVEIHVTPQDDTFLVYTDASNIPTNVTDVLGASMEKSSGLKVPAMLDDLSRRLRAALEGTSAEDKDTAMTDVDDSDFDADDDGDDDYDNDSDADDDFEYGEDNDLFGIPDDRATGATRIPKPIPSSTLRRIRQDLRATRESGFKVGIVSGFHQNAEQSIISISVRVDKLGLSDETRHAWNLEASNFIALLIRFDGGLYTTLEEAIELRAAQSNLEFRLRKCSQYKPTLRQATLAFSSQNPKTGVISAPFDGEDPTGGELSLLSIGTSVDMFMDKDFISMLKLRKTYGISWDAAKRYLSILEKEAMPPSSEDILPQLRPRDKTDKVSDKVPRFLAENEDDSGMPLPLIATKFAMRYLVQCADYCMICHQKVEGNFEALKPYVCGDSLCLFQYMALGFGPSIDIEIINQPRVVDLLVSFCFAPLRTYIIGKTTGLREFPTGLSLPVPNIRTTCVPDETEPGRWVPSGAIDSSVLIDPIKIAFDWDTSTAIIESATDSERLREGQWVVVATSVTMAGAVGIARSTISGFVEIRNGILHYANILTVSGRAIKLRVAARHPIPMTQRIDEGAMKSLYRSSESHMVLFNQNLDDLPNDQKAFSMSLLLSALPSVPDMREFLLDNPGRQLSTWGKIVPASMGLLRWIVASNRSYIVQIDEPTEEEQDDDGKVTTREQERIAGVDGWVQFRFAQGSPEKEALFQQALEGIQKPQRTLLAWHGSDLTNWHSIIRQGLNYSVVLHGRAYGDGVYFSRQFETSMGYSNVAISISASLWPKSELKIDAAMGLAELVNRPEEFRSSNPYFVVQHCHWIQCRYLFVRCSRASLPTGEPVAAGPRDTAEWLRSNSTQDEFVQDPHYVTKGPGGKQLFVPKIAIPSASRNKRQLPNLSSKHDAQGHTGDTGDEDDTDADFLYPDDDEQTTPTATPRANSPKPGAIVNFPPSPALPEPRTDFHPGTLDLSTLPRLNPPTYATDLAQRSIGRELKKLQQVQSSTPIQELGWYIDFDSISNMFQWIVELHSFELSLPLGQDMKMAGVGSIVLEIRFGRDFPMSPPFVRVIRPRFLPFLNGGGGHVTAGGAMCMELLTTTGWSPANSLEAVLVQVRLAMCSVDPRPARLYQSAPGHHTAHDYGVGEAFDAYARAAHTHGWQIPKDQQEMRGSS